MLLSEILKEMKVSENYEIINEMEIEFLALSVSELNKKVSIFIDDPKFIQNIQDNVTMILTTSELKEEISKTCYKGGFCVGSNPRMLFFEIHNHLEEYDSYSRKKVKTKIGKNCKISPMASISENNVSIGDNVKIEEFVVIRENTIIGDNSTIRSGVKIGGEGFEFKRNDGGIMGVVHLGGVVIGNHVEIQYNSCIDKAVYPWDNTVIGDYVKIDNLVHIGHAVKINNNVMVVAQSGIGGRTKIDSDTWIGFSTTISNGLAVGNNARVNIGSVVTKNVEDGKSVTGNFAIEHSKFIENIKKIARN